MRPFRSPERLPDSTLGVLLTPAEGRSVRRLLRQHYRRRPAVGADMSAREPSFTGHNSPPWHEKHTFVPRGQDHPCAVLTGRVVAEMRDAVKAGATIAEVAREHEVSYPTARDAVVGNTWKHLPGAFKPGRGSRA